MTEPSILALLPFMTQGALSLKVMRAMGARGMPIKVAFTGTPGPLAQDSAEDLASEGRVLDLSVIPPPERYRALSDEVARSNVRLMLQIGAARLYPHLPYLKERHRHLQVVDVLYNEVGHVVNHFLYERCMSGVIVESAHMRRFMESRSAVRRLYVDVIENGIDLDAFTGVVRPVCGERWTIGYVGRMSPEKNPLGFIEICERLHEVIPSLSFLMAGNGPMADDVRRAIEGSTVCNVMDYRGFQHDIAGTLRELDILLVPSKLDGRPNAIMEASACGVPVIAAPVGGIPELIEEGQNGYLARPEDTARIIQILSQLRGREGALADLRRSSRACAERVFDQRRMMDRYASVFERYLRGP